MVKSQSQSQTIDARAERIMYLASMTSNAKAIEAYIRPLNSLLVLRTRGDAVTPEEDAVLTRIEEDIKIYILESEKLRSFTTETLEQQVYERVDAKRLIRKLRIQLTIALGITSIIVIATFMLPFAASDVQLRACITAAIAGSYLIGAILFLTSRRNFSTAYATASKIFSYAFIAGSIMTAANLALTVIYKGAVPWNDFWYVATVTYLTFAVMYFGAQRLARLYDIRGIAMNIWWVTILAVAGSVALTFMVSWAWEPGLRSGLRPVGAILAFVFALHAGWLMFRVWRLANPLYRAPTKALGLGLFCMAIAWGMITINPLIPATIGPTLSTISSLLFFVCSLFLVRSGYALSKLSRS